MSPLFFTVLRLQVSILHRLQFSENLKFPPTCTVIKRDKFRFPAFILLALPVSVELPVTRYCGFELNFDTDLHRT